MRSKMTAALPLTDYARAQRAVAVTPRALPQSLRRTQSPGLARDQRPLAPTSAACPQLDRLRSWHHRQMLLARCLCTAVVVVAVFLDPPPAAACTCVRATTPVEAFTRAKLVFVGTVGAITKVDGHVHETTFAVRRVFKGTIGHTAIIRSRWDGVSCDYGRFTTGERMLVYAHHYEGHFYVSGCSGTRRITLTAGADLLFLRGLANRKTGWVWGNVSFWDSSESRANVEIVARGTKYTTRTNADGSFRLELPPGKYVVEPRHPDPRIALARPARPIELVAGDEVFTYFTYQWNGRIRGRVVDNRGQSAANVHVAALYPDLEHNGDYRVGAIVSSDGSGHYEIDLLPEGKYIVAAMLTDDFDPNLPITYYPGVRTLARAREVEVGRGGIRSSIDFTVQPAKLFVLTVTTRQRQSGGAGSVLIRIENRRERRSTEGYADSPGGRASFRETAGSEVTVQACDLRRDGACTKPVITTVDRNRTVSLVLP